jgi:hypothetical protein
MADLYHQSLARIRELADRGARHAAEELTRSDEDGDTDRWSLWRGYHKGMRDILKAADRVTPPAADGPAPPTG